MDIYQKISEFKWKNKLSYSELGSIIYKSPDAFRLALKRKSLSRLEIQKLNSEIDGGGNINNEKSCSEDELNSLALKIVDLDIELSNNKIFKIYIQNKIKNGIIDYLEKKSEN